jgi:stage II sporulation protein D
MPLSIRAGAAPLTVDGAGYRGDLTIRATAGGLETVNVVTLEHYLWGVVPWEVPRGWQTATYEAQAVAARSYALATLHSTADFDLYADDRSQMYGGIRAERPETSYAVNATVGQVLTYSGAIIPAYYFSTSGGWTEAVHAAWPRLAQVPYLVAVPDPFDWISPRHRWPTRVVTPVWLAQRLGLAGVRDAFVTKDSGGRVAQLHLLGPHGWVTFAGNAVRQKLHLRSTFFRLRRLTLDAPARRVLATSRVLVRGSVRGLQHAQLQELVGGAWRIVSYLRVRSNGSFEVALRGRPTMRLRLVAEKVPGDVVTYRVAR